MSRFDYVQYDKVAIEKQVKLKVMAQKIEAALVLLESARMEMWTLLDQEKDATLNDAIDDYYERAASDLNEATGPDLSEALALLERSFMWCGKAIRDEQIERNGSAPLQEGRTNG